MKFAQPVTLIPVVPTMVVYYYSFNFIYNYWASYIIFGPCAGKSSKSLDGLEMEDANPVLGIIIGWPTPDCYSIGPKNEETQQIHIKAAIVNKLLF